MHWVLNSGPSGTFFVLGNTPASTYMLAVNPENMVNEFWVLQSESAKKSRGNLFRIQVVEVWDAVAELIRLADRNSPEALRLGDDSQK
jgi:hypothetical protein